MADNLNEGGVNLDVGDRPTITATFLDEAGDPATVLVDDLTVSLVTPTGTETVEAGDITITDGVVTYEVNLTEPGYWFGTTSWDSEDGAQAESWFAFVRYPPGSPNAAT